uniref:RanBP2-type domain-containing protein n=1 Tax=Chrysotila carterae TaxID=13221 RepID=A0A7S4FBM7_CHRCT
MTADDDVLDVRGAEHPHLPSSRFGSQTCLNAQLPAVTTESTPEDKASTHTCQSHSSDHAFVGQSITRAAGAHGSVPPIEGAQGSTAPPNILASPLSPLSTETQLSHDLHRTASACPVCTYRNCSLLRFCEMCESPLPHDASACGDGDSDRTARAHAHSARPHGGKRRHAQLVERSAPARKGTHKRARTAPSAAHAMLDVRSQPKSSHSGLQQGDIRAYLQASKV